MRRIDERIDARAPPRLQASASTPLVSGVRKRSGPPSSFLPKIGRAVRDEAQVKRAEDPVTVGSGGSRVPQALTEITDFLDAELKRLDADGAASELRLDAHRQAFDLFISHFRAYDAPLSSIKRSYEACIRMLEEQAAANARVVETMQAEFLASHERITSALQQQLQETEERLSLAQKEVARLQNNEDILGEPAAPVGASRTSGESIAAAGASSTKHAARDGAGESDQRRGTLGGKWSGLLAKTVDADPAHKIRRLISSVEKLSVTPDLLSDAAKQLIEMLTAEQMNIVLGAGVVALRSDERVALCVHAARSVQPLERYAFLDEVLRSLTPLECARVIEPLALGLPAAEKQRLLAALMDNMELPEPERLSLTRALLESTPPLMNAKRAAVAAGGARRGGSAANADLGSEADSAADLHRVVHRDRERSDPQI